MLIETDTLFWSLKGSIDVKDHTFIKQNRISKRLVKIVLTDTKHADTSMSKRLSIITEIN